MLDVLSDSDGTLYRSTSFTFFTSCGMAFMCLNRHGAAGFTGHGRGSIGVSSMCYDYQNCSIISVQRLVI